MGPGLAATGGQGSGESKCLVGDLTGTRNLFGHHAKSARTPPVLPIAQNLPGRQSGFILLVEENVRGFVLDIWTNSNIRMHASWQPPLSAISRHPAALAQWHTDSDQQEIGAGISAIDDLNSGKKKTILRLRD